jgi:thiol-disulfide isomerase/thioredoxin
MVLRRWMSGLALLCACSVAASAGVLTLTPPTSSSFGDGAGATRGDIITMTGAYTLTSIGIDAVITNGVQLAFNAYVYDDQGGSGVNQLALGASGLVTGNGTEQWFDLPVSFTLQAGQSYDIGIRFNSYSDSNLDINYFDFTTNNTPFSVGPVTVLDGEESYCGPCNSLAPNLRLDGASGGVSGVPEPGSLILLGTGALVLFGAIRRKRI